MDFQDLPKVELHLHLDCTLSYEALQKLKPGTNYQDYVDNYMIPVKCPSLEKYIERTHRALPLMQNPEQIRLIVDDLFRQLSEDNVIYAEIRYAPHLHLQEGMTPFEVVKTVNDAVEEGIREFELGMRVILCTLRNYSESRSLEVARLVEEFKGTNVAGMDIAGPEIGYDIQEHVEAFRQVKAAGIPCTAHAGESRGAESVWETLKHLRPDRVGHGVRSAEDRDLMLHLRDEDIHLEICPTSNVQTSVIETIKDHPIMTLLTNEISIGINTDARSITGTTLTSEYALLNEFFGWQKKDFLKANLEAVRHAFVDNETKERLRERLIGAYGIS
ncbi:MAG: adenosine deaminase [Saprospiraceae bacterium]|nr:adenosine deaminase [Saprospiraceae bacterium]